MFSPDIIRFCLTFPRATYALSLFFSLKNVTFSWFLWLLAWGGTPWETVQKRVPKWKALDKSQNEVFRAEGSIWTPLKKHEILGSPKNSPKAALGRPKGPKHAQKGAFERCFWYLFGVPCQQWKLCSRVGGSLIYEVPGYPKTAHFSWLFGVWQKEPPGNHFWRTFWDLGGFLRIFGSLPIQSTGRSSSCSKSLQQKNWFFGSTVAEPGYPRLGSHKDLWGPKVKHA